jgi:hypothetical protein
MITEDQRELAYRRKLSKLGGNKELKNVRKSHFKSSLDVLRNLKKAKSCTLE